MKYFLPLYSSWKWKVLQQHREEVHHAYQKGETDEDSHIKIKINQPNFDVWFNPFEEEKNKVLNNKIGP